MNSFLHTGKWFQVLQSNTSNFIQYYSFVCMMLNGFECCYQTLIILFNTNHFVKQLGTPVVSW